jgi:uncharacterized protein with PIN domain
MTYEDVKRIRLNPTAEDVDNAELHKMIDDALEKQIPKKPIDYRFPWSICPNCNGSVYLKQIQEHIGNEETTYCEHCGQALDWGDCE